MEKVYLLTDNPGKIAAANVTFNKFGIEAVPLKLDIPEIQASSSKEIATHAAKEAFAKINKAVIREDHSFFIDELGIPGPYMSYIDKKISVNQLIKILSTLSKKTGHFELAATYIDQSGKIHEFSYQVPIEFADTPRGDTNQRWERIIRFENDDRVFAEYSEKERASVWSQNYEKIAKLML